MQGQRIGYIRVSGVDQNADRQLDGIKLDRTFADKASGKDTERPALKALLEYVREGDKVLVHSMDRLARNLDDLRRVVKDLALRGIEIEFVQERLCFNGSQAPISVLLLSVMGAFAEFERSLIRERQREGIALAKKRGVYRGRKKSLTDEQVRQMHKRICLGETKAHLAREWGISRQTLYQYLRNFTFKAETS